MLFNVKVISPERYEQHLKDLVKKGQTGYVPAGIAQAEHEKNRESNIL
ncbi:cytochrome-c oxidase OS=Streptomyces fumanus OX=67302 GN=ctaC PE=3 SV=1 [Streptomyces fumanus]